MRVGATAKNETRLQTSSLVLGSAFARPEGKRCWDRARAPTYSNGPGDEWPQMGDA